MMTGGLSDTRPADDHVKVLIALVKKDLEDKVGKDYTTYEAVSYASQVVAGTNYFVKVKVGEDDYVHLRIWETLPHEGKEPELTSYQENKTKDDTIEYF